MTQCALAASGFGARLETRSLDQRLAHAQNVCLSPALRRLSGCMNRYGAGGMRSERMSAHAAASVAAATAGCLPGPTAHVERFMARRALFTSRASSHDPGANLPYHGTTVSFEWQLRQARARMAATGAGTPTLASIVCHRCTGGLTTSIPGANWRAAIPTAIVAAAAAAR